MLMSDRDIRAEIEAGNIGLEPLEMGLLQPSSFDVRLDRFFRLFDNHKYAYIDPAENQDDLTRLVEVRSDEAFILHPGEFVLGSTYEFVTLPRDLDDQYLFGPNILVAPVFAAGQTKREVYLPEGEWFDWHTGKHYARKGETFTVDAPLATIPMFARAGAVIPMLEEAPMNTKGLAPKKIQLHVFVPEGNIEYQ